MKRCPQCKGEYPDATQFCPRDGATLEPDDPMIGRVIGGRYRVISRVGKGGMGSVYRGEHIKMRRATAIKILNSALAGSPEFVARFQREAELASTLSHPHAVAIYDFGEDDEGLVYLAMEFLDGEPLSTVLVKRRTLPIDLAVRVARQAAEALDAAHRRGIIHRDFKPDNVMLCNDGSELPVVKVVDFGIAKQTEAVGGANNLTQTGAVLGTPTYMSPEQVADKQLDGRSDLYSLALVVYQMLSGTLPFRAETAQAVMVMRLVEAPVPLRSVAPYIPYPIESVVMKALSREPHGRQASVLEFARELEAAATSTMATPGVPATPPHGFPPNYPTPPGTGVSTYPNQTPHTNPATMGDPTMSSGSSAPVSYPTPMPGRMQTPLPSTAPVTPMQTPMQMTAAVPQPQRRGGGSGIAIAIAAVAIALVVIPVASYVAYVAYLSANPTNGNGNVAVSNQNSSSPPYPSNSNTTTQDPNGNGTANVEYLVGLARDQRDREEYDKAEESARAAVKADPKSAVAAATLADILLDQSKDTEGSKLAQQAVDLDRKSPTAYRVLAAASIANRQFGKAADEAKKALSLGPSADDEGFANIVLADAYSRQNLNDDALAAYNRARQYSGNRPLIQILARLGIADVLASKGNADSGIKDLTALAADSSLGPNARAIVNRNLAKLSLGKQKPADAVSFCSKALETATMPNVKAGIKIIQGLAYLTQKQAKDALGCTEDALKLAGESKELQGYGQAVRGASLVLLGRRDEGIAALRMARQLLPDDADIAMLARQAGADG